jgi:nucleoside-diphosphate-sugar epimerase
MDFNNPNCEESSAYPANPDSEYGWEKLFSERLYLAFAKNYGIESRIARYHNVFGPCGTYQGGREKAPAALCRKVAMANNNESIDVWGSGEQTRSFLIIDECIEGTIRLMRSNCTDPINIGSDESISINQLTKMIINISKKDLSINNISGPVGVNGRNSDNTLIYKTLNWKPTQPLITGMQSTYDWINSQLSMIETTKLTIE